MASELLVQSTVTGTAGSLTAGNYYIESGVQELAGKSLLDFHVLSGHINEVPWWLTPKDIVFCITAAVTIRGAILLGRSGLQSLRRRKSDQEGKDNEE